MSVDSILDTAQVIRAMYAGGVRGGTLTRPPLIVIHTAEGSSDTDAGDNDAVNIARFAAAGGGRDKVSMTFSVDADHIIRCLPDDRVPYTQGYLNPMCLSIEQAGRASYTVEQWAEPDSRRQLGNVATVCAAWCARHKIPVVWVPPADIARGYRQWRSGGGWPDDVRGFITHHDVTLAARALSDLGVSSNHTDPGPNYPRAELLAAVRTILKGPDDMLRLFKRRGGNLALFAVAGVHATHLTWDGYHDLMAAGFLPEISPGDLIENVHFHRLETDQLQKMIGRPLTDHEML